MNNKINSYTNNQSFLYLSKCDLIQKLSCINLHGCPNIEKISIIFSLKQLREKAATRKEIQLRIIGFLFIYVLLGLNPKIQYIKDKTNDYSDKQVKNSFFNQIVNLDNKRDINKFLHFLFVENNFKNNLGSPFISKKNINESTVELVAAFPMSVFQDAFEYSSAEIIDIVAKDLQIKVVFYVNNVNKLENSSFSILSNFCHIG